MRMLILRRLTMQRSITLTTPQRTDSIHSPYSSSSSSSSSSSPSLASSARVRHCLLSVCGWKAKHRSNGDGSTSRANNISSGIPTARANSSNGLTGDFIQLCPHFARLIRRLYLLIFLTHDEADATKATPTVREDMRKFTFHKPVHHMWMAALTRMPANSQRDGNGAMTVAERQGQCNINQPQSMLIPLRFSMPSSMPTSTFPNSSPFPLLPSCSTPA